MTEHGNKDFQWTDELVKDFVRERIIAPCDYLHTQLDDRVDSFKIEHTNTYTSKDNLVSGSNSAGNGKDWEIVSLRYIDFEKTFLTDKYGIEAWLNGKEDKNWIIHSVRRLSDGEVFSIGDEVLWDWIECSKPYLTINGFEICDGTLRILANGDSFNFKNLSESKLRKKATITKPEALFVTHDGKEVFYSKERILEVFSNWCIGSIPIDVLVDLKKENPVGVKFFSTELAAHQYVSENKPQFSIKDFKDILIRYDYAIDMMEDVFSDLKYLGKLNDKK